MGPLDYLIIVIIAVVLGAAVWCIRKAKKKGAKCIGCPTSSGDSGHCSGCSGCCGGCLGGKK